MWADQVPYGHDFRYWLVSPECKKHLARTPVALRGSKSSYLNIQQNHLPLGIKFVRRIIRKIKLTTPFYFQVRYFMYDRKEYDVAMRRINDEVDKRFPRQRGVMSRFWLSDYERYENGKRITIDDDPHAQRQEQLKDSLQETPRRNLSDRLYVAEKLMQIVGKLDAL